MIFKLYLSDNLAVVIFSWFLSLNDEKCRLDLVKRKAPGPQNYFYSDVGKRDTSCKYREKWRKPRVWTTGFQNKLNLTKVSIYWFF